MREISDEDILTMREKLKILLLQSDHENFLFFRTLATLQDTSIELIENVCQGLLDDPDFAEKGYVITIEESALRMKRIKTIQRQDLPPPSCGISAIATEHRDMREKGKMPETPYPQDI